MVIELLMATQLSVWLPPERTVRCDTMGALADCRVEVVQRRMVCQPGADGAVRHCRVQRTRA